MTEYPILIRRMTGAKALTIICQRCETEAVIHPDDILNEGLYMCPRNEYGKPAQCDGSAVMKYDQGDECPGCEKLGFWGPGFRGDDPLKGCCSRKCMLQVEYLKTIRSGR